MDFRKELAVGAQKISGTKPARYGSATPAARPNCLTKRLLKARGYGQSRSFQNQFSDGYVSVDTLLSNSNAAYRLGRTMYFHSGKPWLYISNAKVACSTIKKSMWTATHPDTFKAGSNPHNRNVGPFLPKLTQIANNVARLEDATIFSVVRNPFSRFLSAYQDKIMRPTRDAVVWRPLSARYNFKANSRPSMQTILECIQNDDMQFVDPHFSCQTYNLMWHSVGYDFVGQLEDMDVTSAFLGTLGVAVQSHTPHKTGASNKVLDSFTSREIELIQDIYEVDFKTFNYDTDPTKTSPIASVDVAKVDRRILPLVIQLSASKTRKEFDALEKQLLSISPTQDMVYARLSFGFVTSAELVNLAALALSDKIQSWKVLSKLAERLIQNDYLPLASDVLALARTKHPVSESIQP